MSKRPGDPGYSAGWCIYFRSMGQYDTCEAGVRYDDVGRGMARPCFLPHKAEVGHCDKFRAPTPEEVAAHETWLEGRISLLGKVMAGIKPWRETHKGRSASEIVECPACAGRLHLSISSYNGHVHGRCETEGCASWVE